MRPNITTMLERQAQIMARHVPKPVPASPRVDTRTRPAGITIPPGQFYAPDASIYRVHGVPKLTHRICDRDPTERKRYINGWSDRVL